MFGLFSKSKSKDTAQLVSTFIAKASTAVGEPIANTDQAVLVLGNKITSAWFDSLPPKAIKGCQPSILAAYVLVGEASVHAQPGSREVAEVYIDAAKMATRGFGLRAAAGNASDSECKLIVAMAKMASANDLEFHSELVELR